VARKLSAQCAGARLLTAPPESDVQMLGCPRRLDRYSDCNGDFVLLDALSCGFEADGANESIKIVDDALIEAIELRSL
jgi:hypothetical protein